MVATSSTAAPASENEKRTRKSTIEKVKANHLSRQLQMRLQYARLKVEHGWQKQNLNEVENLYFHNSHLRGSKPFAAPAIVTTQQQHASFPVPHSGPAQSSLSFKLGASSLGRNSVASSLLIGGEQTRNNDVQEDLTTSHDSQGEPIVVDQPASVPNIDPLLRSATLNESITSVAVIPEGGAPSLVIATDSTNSAPAIPHGSGENSTLAPEEPAVSTASSAPSPHDSQSPTDLTQSFNHYPSVKPSRPRLNKGQPSSSRAVQSSSLTAKDMFNFGLASTLTYDSFWSSHSGSTAPRPPRGSFSNNPADLSPAFQIPGDFSSGIQEYGRSNSIFPSSPKPVSAAVHLETPRNLGGLT